MAKVLIVDDSPTEAHVFKTILEKEGHNVLVAKDGGEGVAMARSTLPDLILMDIVLPGLNGFQATRQLARNADTTRIPIIIISTKGEETDKVWGLRQGARDYMVKPIGERDLVRRVSAVLAQ